MSDASDIAILKLIRDDCEEILDVITVIDSFLSQVYDETGEISWKIAHRFLQHHLIKAKDEIMDTHKKVSRPDGVIDLLIKRYIADRL